MTLASSLVAGPLVNLTREPFVDDLQDMRRIAGPEMQRWRAALGNRKRNPAVVWILGDSMSEGFGVTDRYQTYPWVFRRAIQKQWRNGGAGWIPARSWDLASGFIAPADGKNHWVWTGTFTDSNDYGFGFGRYDKYFPAGGTSLRGDITVDGDRILMGFTTGGGTAKITVDGAVSTFSTVGVASLTRQIFWDSGQLAKGTHTVRIEQNTPASDAVFFDGIMVYDTDFAEGVHVYNGGHSGHFATSYDGGADGFPEGAPAGANGDRMWATLAYQPAAPVNFATSLSVTSGSDAFTLTGGGLTALDEGEFLVINSAHINNNDLHGARIAKFLTSTTGRLDRPAEFTEGSLSCIINRSQVTDFVITSGDETATSATAAWTELDVGKFIQGPAGVPAGTYVMRRNSATSIEMSQKATATASAQTLRIVNRSAIDTQPDLIIIALGFNDSRYGIGETAFKAALKGIPDTAMKMGCLEYMPSVVLMPLWGRGDKFAYSVSDVVTTNGTNQIISNDAEFTKQDEGKVVTVTNFSGTPTINTVVDRRTAQLSANANASSTGSTVAFTDREYNERIWQKYRKWMFDLAEDMGWRVFDIYSLGQWVGNAGPTVTATATASAGSTSVTVGKGVRSCIPKNTRLTWTGGVTVQASVDVPKYASSVPISAVPTGLSIASGESIKFASPPIDLVGDAYGLTIDYIHANDRGSQWIGDELTYLMSGVPDLGGIPEGMADAIGEILVAKTKDIFEKKPGIKKKVTADTVSGTTAGVMVDITELAFPIGPGETLIFMYYLAWTAAATTSGILFDFNPAAGVSAPADLIMNGWGPNGTTGAATTGQWYGRQDAVWGTDLTIPSSITNATTIPSSILLVGQVTAGAVGGLITPRFAPEANAATTLQRGSWALLL